MNETKNFARVCTQTAEILVLALWSHVWAHTSSLVSFLLLCTQGCGSTLSFIQAQPLMINDMPYTHKENTVCCVLFISVWLCMSVWLTSSLSRYQVYLIPRHWRGLIAPRAGLYKRKSEIPIPVDWFPHTSVQILQTSLFSNPSTTTQGEISAENAHFTLN